MKTTALIARILLGLIYFVLGLNFFLKFMPVPEMGKAGSAFLQAMIASGYFFQFLKIVEIVGGFFLLINRYTAFFLLLLLPVTVNIFLFHAALAPAGLPLAMVVLVLNFLLCVAYIKYYRSVFTPKTEV